MGVVRGGNVGGAKYCVLGGLVKERMLIVVVWVMIMGKKTNGGIGGNGNGVGDDVGKENYNGGSGNGDEDERGKVLVEMV